MIIKCPITGKRYESFNQGTPEERHQDCPHCKEKRKEMNER